MSGRGAQRAGSAGPWQGWGCLWGLRWMPDAPPAVTEHVSPALTRQRPQLGSRAGKSCQVPKVQKHVRGSAGGGNEEYSGHSGPRPCSLRQGHPARLSGKRLRHPPRGDLLLVGPRGRKGGRRGHGARGGLLPEAGEDRPRSLGEPRGADADAGSRRGSAAGACAGWQGGASLRVRWRGREMAVVGGVHVGLGGRSFLGSLGGRSRDQPLKNRRNAECSPKCTPQDTSSIPAPVERVPG